MAEKMLVTQALDERDLLVKKINDKIEGAEFIDTIKRNEEKVLNARTSKDEFISQAESAYQQIIDLIERYQRIDAAIVESNASTMIHTSYGDYTVAGAISLRARLRDNNKIESGTNFEVHLMKKLADDLDMGVRVVGDKNKSLQNTAENMRLSILGKDSKTKDDKPLEVVEAYVKENTTELVDPLDTVDKVDKLKDKILTLLTELDTQIKVSNATTFIEF